MPDSPGTGCFVFFLAMSLILFSCLDRCAGCKKEENKENNDMSSCLSVVEVVLIKESILHSGLWGQNVWLLRSFLLKLPLTIYIATGCCVGCFCPAIDNSKNLCLPALLILWSCIGLLRSNLILVAMIRIDPGRCLT